LPNGPTFIVREISLAQLIRAADRLGIVVERPNAGAQQPSSKAEKPASASDIKESLSLPSSVAYQAPQRPFGKFNPLLINNSDKSSPIFPEPETLSGPNFGGVV
jgi:hypothetical protein